MRRSLCLVRLRPCQRKPLSTRALIRLADDIKTADDLDLFPYLSSPHWESEALVPQFQRDSVTDFKHAAPERERSELGGVFLRRNREGLVKCANAIVAYKADLTNRTIGTGTAFQVGPGGTLSNGFKINWGRLREHSVRDAQPFPGGCTE
jgi:hypothetical protein